MDVGGLQFLDKIPVKRVYAALGVRVVPPGVARYGSFLSEGVRPDARLRQHRRLGRPADDGRHLGHGRLVRADRRGRPPRGRRRDRRRARAAAGRARDRSRTARSSARARCIVRRASASARARCSRRTSSLTASIPIIDVTGAEPVEYRGEVPPRAVVVPGMRPKEFPGRDVPAPVRAHRRRARARRHDLKRQPERRAARVRDRRVESVSAGASSG